VLRRLRRASLAVLRREIEPADPRAFAAFLVGWQGVDRWGAAPVRLSDLAGIDRLREALVPLQGLALTPQVWERDVLPHRLGAYSPTWLDALCSSGELVWVGAGALGRSDGRVALYFREDAALLGPPTPPPRKGEFPAEALHEQVRQRLTEGACFFTDLLAALQEPAEVLAQALWDLVWAGAITNDAFAPLRASRLALARSRPSPIAAAAPPAGGRRQSRAPRFSARRAARAATRVHPPGRWSLTVSLFAASGAEEVDPSARRRALAELLLERYGILTRELVLAEGVPGGFAALYPELCRLETLGVARRGYFVEGLGGAQFALPGAVERLRAQRAPEEARAVVLAATDPAQPYGAVLAWPARQAASARTGPLSSSSPLPAASAARRPSRVPGAHVVMVGAEPVLYLERGRRALQVLCAGEDPRVEVALGALADAARAGGLGRVALERVNGAPVMGTHWETALAAVGFHAGPRRLTLSA
jgi:ATP-dependent Lhr-like helicase